MFNTVGPRQTGRYGMVVPNFVRQAIAGQPLTVFGDGNQSRCFCHVHDVVQALAGLMERDDLYGEVFNIGSQSEITIRGLAGKVMELIGSEAPITYVPYDKAYEEGFEDMQRRVPDISKIQSVLGWEPTRTLDQIVLDVRDQQLQSSRLSAVAA
jgi:UDP-glucose 4-epimerase